MKRTLYVMLWLVTFWAIIYCAVQVANDHQGYWIPMFFLMLALGIDSWVQLWRISR